MSYWIRNKYDGFTLIELLVVITIIVVLLALLTPALDKAIYQAELARCGAGLHAIGTTAQIYALDHKRYYPKRDGLDFNNADDAQAYKLAHKDDWDDRPRLVDYMDLKLLNCPIAGDVDLSIEGTDVPRKLVFSSFDLWFGFGFTGFGKMQKLGNRLTYQTVGENGEKSPLYRFNLLASDREVMFQDQQLVHNSHPDESGIMANQVRQNETNPDIIGQQLGEAYTKSPWIGSGDPPRGVVDMNFLGVDGGAYRLNDLEVEDDRLMRIPEYSSGKDFPEYGSHVPFN